MKIILWALVVTFSGHTEIYDTILHRETCAELAERLRVEYTLPVRASDEKPVRITCKQQIVYVPHAMERYGYGE